MKRLIGLALCAALITLCLSGCVSVSFWETGYDSVTGEGNREKYEIEAGDFTGIKIRSACNIHYYAGTSDTVTLEIQPNLWAYYSVKVTDGVLVVDTTQRIRFGNFETPVLTVYTPTLTDLSVEGACTFTAHDAISADSFTLKVDGAGSGSAELDVGMLDVRVSGAGSFTLTGAADSAKLNLDGASDVDALGLQTRDAWINLDGMGQVSISCSDNLAIEANGVGSVEYKGSPSVDLDRGGMVTIRKVGETTNN